MSATATVALRAPESVGEKVTLTVHEALTAKVLEPLGQVFVGIKSLGSAPVEAMLLILKGAVPMFVKVTDCAVLVVPRL